MPDRLDLATDDQRIGGDGEAVIRTGDSGLSRVYVAWGYVLSIKNYLHTIKKQLHSRITL